MSWLNDQIGDDWYKALKPIITSEEFKKDWVNIIADYNIIKCYPEKDTIFRAFKMVNLDDVKVVLIGQDPYHDGVSTGLCFDTDGKKSTPSLRKIYEGYTKEYPHNFYTDLMDGKLHRWCEDGIFMINTALSVQKGNANSHTKLWSYFSSMMFRQVLDNIDRPILYIAWGSYAKNFVDLIQNPKHCKVIAKHPASAIYSGEEWDSNGTFKIIETFIKENYDEGFQWEKNRKL